jgi:DNA polymerase
MYEPVQETAGDLLAAPPWRGGPPRPDVDPVGVPATMTDAVPDTTEARADMLRGLDHDVCACLKCPLGETRTRFVFGVGDPDATLMVIGEAPGADEDRQGEPFVGKAGQLLNRILAAIDFEREEVYIANILKCRPPGNRNPQQPEVDACEPYLIRQIQLIRPVVICALGRVAAQTLLKTRASLGKLRENIHQYQGLPLLVTYHPAALLRNPNWKKPAWEDVQLLKKIHDERVSG